jgi:Flp pilus assembly pilin Flp
MRRQKGQALVEYVVLLALAALVVIGTVNLAGHELSNVFAQVSGAIANPAGLIVPPASPTPAPTVAAAAHD